MANTFLLIEKKILTSPAASVEFTSIPQTFTDLVLLISARASANNDYGTYLKFNGSTTDFSAKYMYANVPSAPVSGNAARYIGTVSGSTYWTSIRMYFPNYSGNKTKAYSSSAIAGRYNAGNHLNLIAGYRDNVAPITSISIDIGQDNFTTDTTMYLYGISNA